MNLRGMMGTDGLVTRTLVMGESVGFCEVLTL